MCVCSSVKHHHIRIIVDSPPTDEPRYLSSNDPQHCGLSPPPLRSRTPNTLRTPVAVKNKIIVLSHPPVARIGSSQDAHPLPLYCYCALIMSWALTLRGRMESLSWSIWVDHGDPVFEPSTTTQESQKFQLV